MCKSCPLCKNLVEENYTYSGILWAIFCFPCGLYCCKSRRKLRCKTCDIEIIISDGTFPLIAQAYKSYTDFKWQFRSSSVKIADIATKFTHQQQPIENGKRNGSMITHRASFTDDNEVYHTPVQELSQLKLFTQQNMERFSIKNGKR